MHGFLLNIFLNHSIIIAALIAAFRFKIAGRDYQPFIFFIWLGFINETISLALIYTKGYNTVNSNIYVLVECALILYQFYKWQTISLQAFCKALFFALVVWVFDNLIWHHLTGNNSVFRIVYSVMILYCSVKQVNGLLAYERFSLVKNPVFLVCTAFLMYYSCKVFVEVFNAFQLHLSHACNRNIFTILYVDNCISNIIYAIALLCIPGKKIFTMPY